MDVNSRALEPRGLEKVTKLIDRGVHIPNPLTVDMMRQSTSTTSVVMG